MFHSKFDKEDFERIKNEQIQAINEQSTKPPVIANNVYSKLLYGETSIMSTPQIGTSKSVESITLDDVKAFYKKYFSPNLATIVIVGDVSKEAIMPKLTFLKNWVSTNAVMPKDETPKDIAKTKIFLVNKDKAAQSEIRIGYLAMPYDATGEYFKSGIMNFMLGGAFNSHINMNLREDKAWTYGARSNFNGTKYIGSFTAAAGVKADKSDSSVVEFVKEIRAYATKGITAEELEFTKSSLSQAEALKYESPLAKASFLKRMLDYNLKPDFVEKQAEIMKNITKEEIDKLAANKLPLDKMIITVCGDKAKIAEGLSKLGYEVVEVDTNGNKVEASNNNQPLYPEKK
jgi:zinc protease